MMNGNKTYPGGNHLMIEPSAELFERLTEKQKRGSKPRCHLLTLGERAEVAKRLTKLIEPHGKVTEDNCWMPLCNVDRARGVVDIDVKEARLGKAVKLLDEEKRGRLLKWWLEVQKGADTPNWDIASTCDIGGEDGLLLVEAKAHLNELSSAGKSEPRTEHGWANQKQIGEAINEARGELDKTTGMKWNISRDRHYQMSNRFAWAWKLADIGVPVILVYLGFLEADEMTDIGKPFANHAEWQRAVEAHSEGLIPSGVWRTALNVNGLPLIPLIRSETIDLPDVGDAR